MTDDELAAVLAAFQQLRSRYAQAPVTAPASRWGYAARLRPRDVADARLAQHAPSRWAMSERLRD